MRPASAPRNGHGQEAQPLVDRTPAPLPLRSTLALEWYTLDETTTPFGIRQLTFDPDRGLLVNGQPRSLKGVCLHQDADPSATPFRQRSGPGGWNA